MRRFSILSAVLLIFALSLPAAGLATPDRAGAAKGDGKSSAEKFEEMDKNKDDALSREEFFEYFPFLHESAFKNIDKDGSQSISRDEWMQFSDKHTRDMGGAGMGAGMGGMGGMGGGPKMPRESDEGGQAPQGQGGSGGRMIFEYKPQNEPK